MKKFETLGVMVDSSRDAVMSLQGLKKLIPLIAKMGYNSLFLYMEDVYQVDGEPYIGYLRGRYSKEEMKEIDAFAASFGIEVIPCIQTLAHMERIHRWNQYPMDNSDILMADDDRTYELIDNMLSTLKECFATRRIHLGMDEAHDLGRGKHLDKYGYETVDVIMKRHLGRVSEIARSHGYEIMVWSDMFFRPWNNGNYAIPATTVPEEYVKALPEGVSPVYWDYYSSSEQHHRDMMSNHKQLSGNTWFAGGAWTWGGFLPHNSFSIKTMTAAIKVARQEKIKHVFITMWGDNGGECSRFAVLPSLFYIAQYAKGVTDEDTIKARFKRAFGVDFDDFMLLDGPNDLVPSEKRHGIPVNPAKYMFYNDYFLGAYDYTACEGGYEHFAEKERLLSAAAKKSRKYGHLFDTAAKLSGVLKYKYDLGVRTRAAYQSGDRAELLRLANEDYTFILKGISAFAKAFEKQWALENKPYGIEVHEIRLGGLIKRTESCRRRLLDYASGKISEIPELSEQILPYGDEKKSIYANQYRDMVTACDLG